MIISIVVAKTKNNVIGKDNSMPWRLSEDLKNFKKLTLNKPIIMGRKTHESIGRALPSRENIVMTTNKNYVSETCKILHNTNEVINYCLEKDFKEVFIIGGNNIYKEFIELADNIYVTEIDAIIDGDTYFPNFDNNKFVKKILKTVDKDINNNYHFNMVLYKRK